MKRPPRSRHPITGEAITRLSISISAEDKAALERIAFEKKVSLAWVLRDAASKYLEGGAIKSLNALTRSSPNPADVPPPER